MKTKYTIVGKVKQLQPVNTTFKLPDENFLIPQNFDLVLQEQKTKNSQPIKLSSDQDPYQLWLLQDQVYRRPRVIIEVLFYIPQIVNTPLKKGLLAIFNDVFVEKVTKNIGYQANMADVSYVVNLYENFGLKFEFRGYNSKTLLILSI